MRHTCKFTSLFHKKLKVKKTEKKIDTVLSINKFYNDAWKIYHTLKDKKEISERDQTSS